MSIVSDSTYSSWKWLQASLLWYMGLRQADMKRLRGREYMSVFGVNTATLQARLRFLRDEVLPPQPIVTGSHACLSAACNSIPCSVFWAPPDAICAHGKEHFALSFFSAGKRAKMLRVLMSTALVPRPFTGAAACMLARSSFAHPILKHTLFTCVATRTLHSMAGGLGHEAAAHTAAALARWHDIHNRPLAHAPGVLQIPGSGQKRAAIGGTLLCTVYAGIWNGYHAIFGCCVLDCCQEVLHSLAAYSGHALAAHGSPTTAVCLSDANARSELSSCDQCVRECADGGPGPAAVCGSQPAGDAETQSAAPAGYCAPATHRLTKNPHTVRAANPGVLSDIFGHPCSLQTAIWATYTTGWRRVLT